MSLVGFLPAAPRSACFQVKILVKVRSSQRGLGLGKSGFLLDFGGKPGGSPIKVPVMRPDRA